MSRTSAITTAIAFVVALSASSGVQAGERSPAAFQLALWNPVQIVDSNRSVHGARYSLFLGVNRDLVGFDLATFMGSVEGDLKGAQSSILLSYVSGHARGVQQSVFGSVAEETTGLQLSGLFNVTTSGRGVQFAGWMNFAQDMKGVQIGVLNFNKNGIVPFMPIMNFNF